MSKILLYSFLATFLFQTSLYAEVDCPEERLVKSPNAKIEDLASKMAVIAEKAAGDDSAAILEAATTYLMSIAYTENFNESEANNFILKVTPLCESSSVKQKFRSTACTRLSGLHGKIAQKLQLGGISNGKKAYTYLKKALELDPNNRDAITGHANTVYAVYNKGFLARKAVEINLGVSINEEVRFAKTNLERINQSNSPLYRRILDIM